MKRARSTISVPQGGEVVEGEEGASDEKGEKATKRPKPDTASSAMAPSYGFTHEPLRITPLTPSPLFPALPPPSPSPAPDLTPKRSLALSVPPPAPAPAPPPPFGPIYGANASFGLNFARFGLSVIPVDEPPPGEEHSVEQLSKLLSYSFYHVNAIAAADKWSGWTGVVIIAKTTTKAAFRVGLACPATPPVFLQTLGKITAAVGKARGRYSVQTTILTPRPQPPTSAILLIQSTLLPDAVDAQVVADGPKPDDPNDCD